jgi:hypothetical protein
MAQEAKEADPAEAAVSIAGCVTIFTKYTLLQCCWSRIHRIQHFKWIRTGSGSGSINCKKYSWKILYFFIKQLQFTYPYASLKDVQATGKSFSPLKRTSRTFEIINFFRGSFLSSWIRIRICNLNPDQGPHWIRIRNTALRKQRCCISSLFTPEKTIKIGSSFTYLFNYRDKSQRCLYQRK